MKAPGYQNINNIKLMQQNIGCNILAFSDILEDLTSSVTKVKKDEYSVIGKYSIIDQGKEFIAGYYNSNEGISSSGPHIVFGDHTRIFKYVDFPILLGADGTKLLAAKISDVNMKYLYYFFNTLSLPNDGYSRHFKYLKQVIIPLPNIQYQNKIVNILDQAQELIDKRKAQIEALDELIQSVFYDMFGDPIQNPKGFNKKAIGKEFEIKTGATPSRKDETYWDNGTIPWVKTTELKEVVIYDTDECITELGFNNSSVNLLPKNTLLIAMYGQGKTRGMTGKLGIEATTNQACAALLPTDKNNQDFIWIQLRCLYEELRNLGRGGNQPNLNTNLIKSFEILFPPIELQNQFAEIVASIQKQKELLNESLVELENNFNSLMHRAFKGELF